MWKIGFLNTVVHVIWNRRIIDVIVDRFTVIVLFPLWCVVEVVVVERIQLYHHVFRIVAFWLFFNGFVNVSLRDVVVEFTHAQIFPHLVQLLSLVGILLNEMLLFMSQQLVLPTKTQTTIITTERFLTRMYNRVSGQISLGNERLRTLRTNERLLSGVDPHVF